MNVYIYTQPREHNPPHFHLRRPGEEKRFTIKECEPMDGNLRGREMRILRAFWVKRKEDLERIFCELNLPLCE